MPDVKVKVIRIINEGEYAQEVVKKVLSFIGSDDFFPVVYKF